MNLAEQYAHALFEARRAQAGEKSGALIQNLKEVLRRRGHTKLMPRIYAEYKKLSERALRRVPTITMARESDKKAAVEKAREFLPDQTPVKLCTDPSLASGFVISGPNFRFDQSGRRRLLELYNRLINIA